MPAKKLLPEELHVESFATIIPDNNDPNETFTGFYGQPCISLPPNCLQSARKCN